MKENDFDKNFDYIHYKNDEITEKIIKEANWILSLNEAYLINGIIRKHKPKNCLEIGVAYGGSSVLILNAIKDLSGSYLVSLDLFLTFKQKEVGYIVKQKFPELMDKWKLVTGNMPHKYLEKLNLSSLIKIFSPIKEDIKYICVGIILAYSFEYELNALTRCHIVSCKTIIALSFKNGKASIKLKNSPGLTWAVSKNRKSNFIFKFSK